MTLIILLLVLVVERTALQGPSWRIHPYLSWYCQRARSYVAERKFEPFAWLIMLATPAILVGLILMFIDSTLVDFIVSLLVLGVVVGNKELRTLYRQYLNAKSRGDVEGQYILANDIAEFGEKPQVQLEQDSVEKEPEIEDSELQQNEVVDDRFEEKARERSLGEALIWHNFKYYAAPIFYFVLFCVPGVILYCTLLYVSERKEYLDILKPRDCSDAEAVIRQWLEWAFWLPARLVSLGYMFVGHFSNGLETWLKKAVNMSVNSKQVLTSVALASEANSEYFVAEEMVSLAKRNMVLFLVVVALLTLYGQII